MPTGKVPLRWRIFLRALPRLPQGFVSRLWGRASRVELPGSLQGRLNRAFARAAGVDLEETELAPERYASLSAFFARGLKEGARSWPAGAGVVCSPADGILGTHGSVEEGRVIQAKGLDYSVGELLGSSEDGHRFGGGVFSTIYLSPRHYHRVHAPCFGSLRVARAIPGRLLPVAPPAVASIRDLFPQNERLVAIADCGRWEIAVVAVGAFNVGAISADFDPEWTEGAGGAVTNTGGSRRVKEMTYDPPLSLKAGDPLMTFHLGSTVVVLVRSNEGPRPFLDPELEEGREIQAGTPLLKADGPTD